MRTLARRWFVVLICGGLLFIMGNVPAPYYACEGKSPGDACSWGYGCRAGGRCQVDDECEDNPATEVDECLICVNR